MASLQVRLNFQGGEDMRRELKRLGVEGNKSFSGLRKAAAATGDAFKAVGKAVVGIGKTVAAIGGVAAAAGAAIFALAKSSAEVADAAGKSAQKVGINAKAYQELSFAAGQAGVSVENLETGLIFLNKALAAPNPKQLEILKNLGVNLKDASGRAKDLPRILLDLADAFQRLPDGIQKTNAAAQLFGARSGAELIPLLNGGAKGIADLADEANRLGLILDDKAIKQSTAFNDQLDELFNSIKGVKNQIGQVFIPELTRLADLATEFVVKNRTAIIDWVQKGWDVLKSVVLDLVALFEGREGDVVNKWIISARDGMLSFVAVLNDVYTIVKSIAGLFISTAKFFTGDAVEAPKRNFNGAQLNLRGLASGGRVRGPGTSTSDSVLARLSRGEYVIKASAVDHFGSGVFDALNRRQMPAFAEGGMVGGRPVTVNFGGESFPMQAGDGVVDRLIEFGRKKSIRSGGRAPSWVTKP